MVSRIAYVWTYAILTPQAVWELRVWYPCPEVVHDACRCNLRMNRFTIVLQTTYLFRALAVIVLLVPSQHPSQRPCCSSGSFLRDPHRPVGTGGVAELQRGSPDLFGGTSSSEREHKEAIRHYGDLDLSSHRSQYASTSNQHIVLAL